MKIILLVVTCVLAGCQTVTLPDFSNRPSLAEQYKIEFTPLQLEHLKKYNKTRWKIAVFILGVPPSTTLEAAKPDILRVLKLPDSTSWSEVVRELENRAMLTEVKRLKVVATFKLPPTIGWFEILELLEEIRFKIKE